MKKIFFLVLTVVLVLGAVPVLASQTPKELKQTALSSIQSLEPTDKWLEDRINKATEHIERSLAEKLWENNNHLTLKGKKVFKEEKKAAKELKKVLKEKNADEYVKSAAMGALNLLVDADKLLAQTAIEEAIAEAEIAGCQAGDDDPKCKKTQKEIDKAEKEMAKAQKEREKGKYDKAIDHYKKAWKHACKAFSIDLSIVESWVGPSGGTVSHPDGASVVIPPGALSEETLITIAVHHDAASLPAPTVPSLPFLGGVNLGPDGIAFLQPVTITIPLTTELTPGSEYPLFLYDEQRGGWLKTEFFAVVNPDGLSASADVTHFSDFIIYLEPFPKFAQDFFKCNVNHEELFESLINRWSNTFEIGEKFPKEYCTDCGFGYRDYACYQYSGIDYTFRYSLSVPDPNDPEQWVEIESWPFERETGEKGTFAFVYIDDDQRIVSILNECEIRKSYSVEVTVWLRCTHPNFTLQTDKSTLCIGEQTPVRARLTCGGQGLVNQEINFPESFTGSDIGDLSESVAFTNSDGEAAVTFTAKDMGIAILEAVYEACFRQEDPELLRRTFFLIEVPEPVVESVEVEPPEVELLVGDSTQLTAVVWDSCGDELEDPGITWSSSKEDVAEVTDGIVTALSTGTAAITATVNGVSGTATVTVTGQRYSITWSMTLHGEIEQDMDNLPYWTSHTIKQGENSWEGSAEIVVDGDGIRRIVSFSMSGYVHSFQYRETTIPAYRCNITETVRYSIVDIKRFLLPNEEEKYRLLNINVYERDGKLYATNPINCEWWGLCAGRLRARWERIDQAWGDPCMWCSCDDGYWTSEGEANFTYFGPRNPTAIEADDETGRSFSLAKTEVITYGDYWIGESVYTVDIKITVK